MHILITGAAGMIGHKLSRRLLADGSLGGRTITRMTLHDVIAPEAPADARCAIDTLALDIAGAGAAERLLQNRPDVVFHLAAIVSGEAEQDFDKGYRINFEGTWRLFEQIRQLHLASDGEYCPRVVFTSSIAVFGAPSRKRSATIFITRR